MLAFKNLHFSYSSRVPIFDDFSFCFPAGKTVLLGQNGAGKSTLFGLATQILRPLQGMALIGDKSGRKALRHLGYMPQVIRPMVGLTVREQVAYCGWLQGMGKRQAWEASLTALQDVHLEELAGRPSQKLSGGQMRRVGLACARIHRPTLMLLDEPSAGLDPIQRSLLRENLAAIPDSVQFIVSTHLVDDIDEIYDNVVVLYEGKIIWSGSVVNFANQDPDKSSNYEHAFISVVRGFQDAF